MQVVPRLATPLGMAALPGLVQGAFQALGAPLSAEQRVNLAALVAIETGRGKSLFNGNVGNISAGAKYPGMVWRPPWFEISETSTARDRELHAGMLAGKVPSAFRAYSSVQDGALDFARVMLKSYPHVMRAADSRDVDTFRVSLSKGYAPEYANPAVTATLTKLRAELGASSSGASAVGLIVASLLAWWVWTRAKTSKSRQQV